MAFEKRTWLARIGAGLNKFIIGNKDGEGKQTLTNAPDSVTQIGDVISAENLNDLEERIETAVNANETAIAGMKLTKIWENPSPTSEFNATSFAINSEGQDIVIEYAISNSASNIRFMKWIPSSMVTESQSIGSRLDYPFAYASSMFISARTLTVALNNGEYRIAFESAFASRLTIASQTVTSATAGQDNRDIIPLYIYKVGDIYTT